MGELDTFSSAGNFSDLSFFSLYGMGGIIVFLKESTSRKFLLFFEGRSGMSTDESEQRLLDFMIAFDVSMHRGEDKTLEEWQREFSDIREQISQELPRLKGVWEENQGLVNVVPPCPERKGDVVAADEYSEKVVYVGNYRLLKNLGQGGQGRVFLAEHSRSGTRVALKVLNGLGSDHGDALIRFRREADIASKLNHWGICQVYEIGEHNGNRFIAMGYIDGKSLSQLIKESPDVPASSEEIIFLVKLIEKVARALHSAHEAQIIHRDIKPGNIMVTPTGNPVIVDFGLAMDTQDDSPTLTGTRAFCGTLAFMPPERLSEGMGETHLQADVYALGVTLYQALCHKLPFRAATPEALQLRICRSDPEPIRHHNTAVSKDLSIVIATAMEGDPKRRYATAEALADDLKCLIEGTAIQARSPGLTRRVLSWTQRNRWATAALAVLIVLVSILFVFLSREARFTESLLRLNDHRRATLLLEREALDLYPVGPELIAKAEVWLDQERELQERRADHELTKVQISQRRGSMATRAQSAGLEVSMEELVTDLLAEFDRLRERAKYVEGRVARARHIQNSDRSSVNQERWRTCIESIQNLECYGGLKIRPQSGLVPLGRSAQSGFWEFLHVDTGKEPEFVEDLWQDSRWQGAPWDRSCGDWALTPDSGIVLVLLPGGEFDMGARVGPANAKPEKWENDVHRVRLSPFFISKFEMTQAQWVRCSEGQNPSWYFPGTDRAMDRKGARPITWTHPVESMTWETAKSTLWRIGLDLPTESQWEYAARGGTSSAFSCGDSIAAIALVANILGQEMPEEQYPGGRAPTNDRYFTTSPVGSFGPNPFGIYDVHGNVSEWCLDGKVANYRDFKPRPVDGLRQPKAPTDLRIHRGGNYKIGLAFIRSSARNWSMKNQGFRNAGIRPARRLEH